MDSPMTQSDTHPKAESVQIELIRRASVAERFARVRSLSRTMAQLSWRAISRANPGLSDAEINILFARYHYGDDLADRLEAYLRNRES